MENELLIYLGVGLAVVLLCVVIALAVKKNKWVSTENFNLAKMKLKTFCSENDFNEFMSFLKSYKGGFVRRRSGEIVYQDYLGKEKGDLKGIFYNIIVPNPNLSVGSNEEFRKFMMSIGVIGVENRPSYETRDSKLKNKETEENDFRRKEVGNKGEQIVRSELDRLNQDQYFVINGPVIKNKDIVKEFDHIVIGSNGLFVIETKAFGMSDGKPCKAALFVDKGDKWIIRKKQQNREVESPTEQVLEEKDMITSIISCPVEIHSVLVLSNTELYIKCNIDLPYHVVRADELREFIENYDDRITQNDRTILLQDIDGNRVN